MKNIIIKGAREHIEKQSFSGFDNKYFQNILKHSFRKVLLQRLRESA